MQSLFGDVFVPFGRIHRRSCCAVGRSRAGKETRQQIKETAENVKVKAEDYYKQVKETVTSALEHGKDLVAEKKQLIAKAVQKGIEAYENKE